MNQDRVDLEAMQRWMLAVITDPHGVESGLASPAARKEMDVPADRIDEVITPSRSRSSLQRLSVYGNAYFARLIECLKADFPAVHQAVGEEAFGGFVMGYLGRHPSKSETLGDLGGSFAEYLDETRPPYEGVNRSPDWSDFIVDLARLERIYSEVFDGAGEEQIAGQLSPEVLQAIPADQWGDLRLLTSQSLRLVRVRFPVHEYISAIRQGKGAAIPPARPTWLAVHRRDYVVRRRELSESEFALLAALREGLTLKGAIMRAVATTESGLEALCAQFEGWFRDWTLAGYFRGIEGEGA